jgi:lactam utilization protein B
MCPPSSAQAASASELGLRVLREVFLDRAYHGARLRPRTEPGAVITSLAQLDLQLEWLAKVEFDTMCVHGDNQSAPALLAHAREVLPHFGLRAAPYGL